MSTAELDLLDRLAEQVLFGEGIADAVRGLRETQRVECRGVLALIDAHVIALRTISEAMLKTEAGE